MSTVAVRTIGAWIARLFQWIDLYSVYGLEIFVVVIILLAELRLLLIFLTKPFLGDWLLLCLWAFVPSIHLQIQPISIISFWGMFVILFALIILPVVAVYLGRVGLVRIIAWSRDPNAQSLRALRRERARLAYLQVRALEEYEDIYYLKHGAFPSVQSLDPHTISKFSGYWSLYYALLSNYLRLPPASLEESKKKERVVTDAGDPPQEHPQQEQLQEQEQPQIDDRRSDLLLTPYAIFLFGEVRIFVNGLRVKLEQRVLQALSYIVLPARERDHTRLEIASALHDQRFSDDEVTNRKLLDAFAYDVRVLRERLEGKCKEAGIPYVDPIVADHGRHAINRLANEYVAVDVVRLERMGQKMARLKEDQEPPLNLQEFRKEYEEAVLSLPADGLFGRHLRKDFAAWHRAYYVHYLNMHHHLLWDLAEYEYALSCTQQGEERVASLRQAVQLYERCMLLTAPSKEELKQGAQGRLSEQALRQCMLAYKDLGDISSVHLIHHHYEATMRRKYVGWQEEPETAQVFEEITTGLAEERRGKGTFASMPFMLPKNQ